MSAANAKWDYRLAITAVCIRLYSGSRLQFALVSVSLPKPTRLFGQVLAMVLARKPSLTDLTNCTVTMPVRLITLVGLDAPIRSDDVVI